MIVRLIVRPFLLIIVVLSMAACDSGGSGADDADEGPAGDGTSLSATIDGSPFAANRIEASFFGSNLIIIAQDTVSGNAVHLTIPQSDEGQYNLGEDGVAGSWIDNDDLDSYFEGTSGNIIIDPSNEDAITGSFEFRADNTAAGKRQEQVVMGSFNVLVHLAEQIDTSTQPGFPGIACLFITNFFAEYDAFLWNPADEFFLPVGGFHFENGQLVQLGFNAQTFGAWTDFRGEEKSYPAAGYEWDISLSLSVGGDRLESGMQLPLGHSEEIPSLVDAYLSIETEDGLELLLEAEHFTPQGGHELVPTVFELEDVPTSELQLQFVENHPEGTAITGAFNLIFVPDEEGAAIRGFCSFSFLLKSQ